MNKAIKDKQVIIILFMLFIFYGLSILFPYFSHYSYDEIHVNDVLLTPNSNYWFGTDEMGRDLLARVMFGAKISLTVALVSSMVSLILGFFIGALSGWKGGWVDNLFMRIIDIFDSIPLLIILILFKLFIDSLDLQIDRVWLSLFAVLLSISLVSWISIARVVRLQVLSLKNTDYIQAARAIGGSSFNQIMRHILPNTLAPILVVVTYKVPSHIMFESLLSFLGIGIQAPYSSWGVLINDGWQSMQDHPHLIIFPALGLIFVSVSLNLLGDRLSQLIGK